MANREPMTDKQKECIDILYRKYENIIDEPKELVMTYSRGKAGVFISKYKKPDSYLYSVNLVNTLNKIDNLNRTNRYTNWKVGDIIYHEYLGYGVVSQVTPGKYLFINFGGKPGAYNIRQIVKTSKALYYLHR
jgi:hypothetical protein